MTVGVQGLLATRTFWLGVGPTVNVERVAVAAGTGKRTSSATRLGLDLGAGVTFPRGEPLFLEVAVERRFVRSLDVSATPVIGAPAVPAMRVPLSHTVLSIGVGWRF